jgi:hypothetical protein
MIIAAPADGGDAMAGGALVRPLPAVSQPGKIALKTAMPQNAVSLNMMVAEGFIFHRASQDG